MKRTFLPSAFLAPLVSAALLLPAHAQGTSGDWSLNGNAGTDASINFLGTTDNQLLTLRSNNIIGWRLSPGAAGTTPSILGGAADNTIGSGLRGGFIGGGGFANGDTPLYNSILGDYGVVARRVQ